MGRTLLLYGVCAALALFIGFLVATPTATSTVLVLAMTVVVLSFPLMLRWHYPLLVYGWNASIILFFLPGPSCPSRPMARAYTLRPCWPTMWASMCRTERP